MQLLVNHFVYFSSFYDFCMSLKNNQLILFSWKFLAPNNIQTFRYLAAAWLKKLIKNA